MSEQGGPDPARARDAADLVGLMRELRDRSGLTYRQLQERAAEQGRVLPRSTISAALARTAVPRAEVLEALVTACGDEPRLGAWLEARERIAGQERGVPGGDGDGDGDGDDGGDGGDRGHGGTAVDTAPAVGRTGRRRRWRGLPGAALRPRLMWLPMAAAVLALGYGAFGVVLPRTNGDERSSARTSAAETLRDHGGPFSLFEARSTKGATIASVGYRYWDTGDGWYGIEYVMPQSRDDRDAYDDGWGGRLIMHYEDSRGSHTAALVDNPDGAQDVGRNGVRYGLKNVWFEVCDSNGRELHSCQRLRKARTRT
ncbi:helix-turn-helix domain-containing protein [Streptomyces griseocarneus]|uniref:helix-turn-helix domain-containing protein n=1 Tax=Streptomyces griseocarneus TaxID=51201 RepID=UPI00167C949F|nr:helix-turn-helix transcriptional regulator [Streptomyces griseocarneus]MBZ6472334.1 helix-turn-helix transcriptional regulator [Streptomyces griseocarneus]GHG72558.1 hypothetical protein GCM10018779_48010 [Streptomyces griseocarneus]